jgi:integrase
MALTDTKIRKSEQLKPKDKVFRVADGKGLCLEVRPNGSKLWRYRYRLDGKASMLSLGEYPTVGLEEAREARKEASKLVKAGSDPVEARRKQEAAEGAARNNTFKAVSEEWLKENKPHWTDKTHATVQRSFKKYLYPDLGDIPIQAVTAPMVRKTIKAAAKTAPTGAIMLLQRVSAVFRYAVMHDLADHDPAAALKGLVKRPEVRHNPPIPQKEIPEFLAAIETHGCYPATKIAVRLLLLTFVRTIELRGAKWSEIDLDSAIWRIPKERMKKRREHVVPLSTQAVELLKDLHTRTGHREHLFPNERNPRTFMSESNINRVIKATGYGGVFSAHGFRTTASTMLNELGYRSDLIERQLAHAESNSVRASYNQAEYLQERREMMQTWADLINQPSGNVVAGRFGKESA